MTASTAEPTIPTCTDTGLPCAGRRAVLRGAAALGAVGMLTACGGGGGTDTAAPATGTGTDAPPAGGSEPGGSSAGGGAKDLGPASKVPVGGGFIYDDAMVVVTQPTAGEYKAFSAVCTHEQCIVTSVEDKLIMCACHLSEFSIVDGSVKGGLAKKPLPAMKVSVEGGNLKVT